VSGAAARVAAGRALAVTRGAAIVALAGAIVSPPLANAAALATVVAFFLVPDWRARLGAMVRSRLGFGVRVFAAALVLAAAVGAAGPQGVRAAAAELLGWRTLLLLLIAGAVFDEPRPRVRAMAAVAAVATVAALASIVALHMGWQYKDQPAGVLLRNTVTQAITFALGAYFCGVLLLLVRRAPRWAKALLVASMLLLLWQLLFVQVGRSGQAVLLVLAFVSCALLLHGWRRVAALLAVPAAALAVFSASPVMQARFAQAMQEARHAADLPEYTSMGIRVVMWQNTVELIRARPVLGYGLGGLEPAYAQRIQDRYTGWKATVTGDAHNQYLMLWVEAGLAGLLAFVLLLVQALRQPAPQPWRAIGLALLAAWCTTSLFSSHFETFNEGHLIALLLGVFLAPPQAGPSAASTAASTSS
jgi:O-antigen ligase